MRGGNKTAISRGAVVAPPGCWGGAAAPRRPRIPVLPALVAGLLAVAALAWPTPSAVHAMELPTSSERYWLRAEFVSHVSHARFIRNRCDDAGHVTYAVSAVRRTPPGRPAVYLIGGSGVRVCIGEPDSLGRRITARCGRGVTVKVLATSEQHFASTLTLVDNLPQTPGVVVIGVHHTQFAFGQQGAGRQLRGYPLPLVSPGLMEWMAGETLEEPAFDIMPGVRTYLRLYRQRRGVAAFRGRAMSYNRLRYSQASVWPLAEKRSRVTQWLIGRGRPGGPFFANLRMNGRLLEAAVSLARRRGFKVIIMESPQDKAVVGSAWARHESLYRAICRDIAARHGARYVNLNATAGLVDGDFHDLVHLVPSGRTRWERALSRVLAPLVAGLPRQTEETDGTQAPENGAAPAGAVLP